MSSLLTSWKEIARHFDKGVRTVQRWEQELGLPVRRPNASRSRSIVFAFTEELDAWVKRLEHDGKAGESEEALSAQLQRLRAENESLRRELALLKSTDGRRSPVEVNGRHDHRGRREP